MKITHEEFQKARRISRAIQEHLEQINDDGLRSTDLYSVLAKKKLIEKDKGNGIHFRKFLKKLKDDNLLQLIPQCKFRYSTKNPNHFEWYFYRTNKDLEKSDITLSTVTIPKLPESEINELITKAKSHITKLPKKEVSKFTYTQLETRKLYERAYEKWTDREIEIMNRAYKKFGRIDKVAELLKRQPSSVEKKIATSLYRK